MGRRRNGSGCFSIFGHCCLKKERVDLVSNQENAILQGANVCDGRDSNELMK